MFIVTVPREFTTANERLTWTIVANGQPTSIPLRVHPDYNVSPFTDTAVKNTPPILRFDERGPGDARSAGLVVDGRHSHARVSSPLALTLWTEDDAKFASGTMALPRELPPPVQVFWSQYRGPGPVKFDQDHPKTEIVAGGAVNVPFRGKATTTATFSEPGEYVLHATANDFSGEGGSGEVCCWTTALVKVSVTP